MRTVPCAPSSSSAARPTAETRPLTEEEVAMKRLLWLGVGFAGLSAMLTVIVMFVFPLWAMAVLVIDFLVLFGLLTQSDEFLA